MRLTIKGGRLYVPLGTKKAAQTSVNHENYVKMYNKLADLEDIEDELGIDLITLFNTYINGFYVKGEIEKQYIDFENPLNSIAFKNGEMFYRHKWSYQYVKLKDYGKTWALTKEELEQFDKNN